MADAVVEIREPGKGPVRVEVREAIEVGRECDGVNLTDPKVSRRHVSISVRDGSVVVEDLGSSNGTFVGGARLDTAVALHAGSVVRIGDTEIEIVAVRSAPPATTPPESAPHEPPD